MIYTHIELPLTALTEFEKLGETDTRFKILDELVKKIMGCGTPKRKNTYWIIFKNNI